MPSFKQAAQLLSIGPWGSQSRGLEEVLGLGLGVIWSPGLPSILTEPPCVCFLALWDISSSAVLWLCDGLGEVCLKKGFHRGITSPSACASSRRTSAWGAGCISTSR